MPHRHATSETLRTRKPNALCVVLILMATLGICRAFASDFFVDGAGGNDSNPGTLALPWKTISFACHSSAVTPGSTINIRGGVYNELVTLAVSGSAAGGYVTIQNYQQEAVVLDGTGQPVSSNTDNALVTLNGAVNYVRIQGLEIRNYQGNAGGALVAGVLFEGSGTNLELRNNHVHDIKSTAPASNRNAHAIGIYGNNASQPIQNLILDGNTVDHCQLGNSEAVALNGNVAGFQVTNNVVHDNDNIGILMVGFEGTATSNDQARDGVVRGNTVYGCSTLNNPSYSQYSSGGIYVDGGANILIERNDCHGNDIGIEIGCEHAGKIASNMIVRDNVLYGNLFTGLAFGGYDTNRGTTINSQFLNNTLFMNDTGNTGTGELLIQQSNGNTVKNCIFFASAQGLILTNPFSSTHSFNNSLDYNLYFEADGSAANSQWQWQNKSIGGFASFKTASNQDTHSQFANPQLVSTGAPPNLNIASGSPAIDGGDPALSPAAGETDFAGNPRLSGSKMDIGAFEFQAGSPPPPPPPPPNLPVITSAATASPAQANVGQSVTFTVSATDPNSDPLTYVWNFGDQSSGSGAALTHIYTAAGTYTAIVTVSDENGSVVSSTTVTVTTSATPGLVTLKAIDQFGNEVAGAFIDVSGAGVSSTHPTGTQVQLSVGKTYKFRGNFLNHRGTVASVKIAASTAEIDAQFWTVSLNAADQNNTAVVDAQIDLYQLPGTPFMPGTRISLPLGSKVSARGLRGIMAARWTPASFTKGLNTLTAPFRLVKFQAYATDGVTLVPDAQIQISGSTLANFANDTEQELPLPSKRSVRAVLGSKPISRWISFGVTNSLQLVKIPTSYTAGSGL